MICIIEWQNVLNWALMRKKVLKIYINLIQEMYEDSRTSFKSLCEVTEDFNEGVGVNQESTQPLFVLCDN